MPKKPLGLLLRYVQHTAGSADAGEVGDAELLRRFARTRDETVFEVLVWRHGPMVLGLCQRLLRQEQDAEDAFQATFLALARKAGSIGKRHALASWLYTVAYRVACRARRKAPVTCLGTAALAELPAPDAEPDLMLRDLRAVLDGEVARLPERYRRPMVLCYFEGKTQEEAARLLGCPKGTVAARLSRARERLRPRLVRRGLALSSAALAGMLADETLAAAVPAHLAHAAIGSALTYSAGKAAGLCSANAVALTEGVLRMMWYSKIKMVSAFLVAAILVGTGIGLGVRYGWAGTQGEDPPAVQADRPLPQEPQPPPDAKAKRGRNSFPAKDSLFALQQEVKKLRGELDIALQEIKRLQAGPPAAKERDLPNYEVIRLRHGDAANVAKVLTKAFPFPDVVTVIAVPDTNSVLLRSRSEPFMGQMKLLINQSLDSLLDSSPANRTWIVGPLKYARATEMAQLVRRVHGEMKDGKPKSGAQEPVCSVVADDRANILLLTCSMPRYDEISKLVQSLEKVAQDTPPRRVRLIRLKHMTAAAAAKILEAVWRDSNEPAVFAADERTNQLVLRCSPTMESEITSLIRELDVKGAGAK
jgi:RNA polymerase sigma factor (sigma-70 family)